MSPATSIKNRKPLVVMLVTLGALVLSAIVLYVFHGGLPKRDEPKPEVISKRAKIEEQLPPAQAVPGPDAAAAPASEPATQAAAKETPQTASAPGSAKKQEQAPAKAQANAAKPAEVKQAVAKAEAVKEPASKPQEKPAVKAVSEKSKPEKAAKSTEKQAREDQKKSQTKSKEAAAAANPWAINVASFNTKSEADSLINSLKSKGYNSYITETTSRGKKWYRVRVGFFRSEDEARRAARSISERHNISSTWVVRPTAGEVSGHSR